MGGLQSLDREIRQEHRFENVTWRLRFWVDFEDFVRWAARLYRLSRPEARDQIDSWLHQHHLPHIAITAYLNYAGASGLTMRQIAEKTGCSHQYIHKVLRQLWATVPFLPDPTRGPKGCFGATGVKYMHRLNDTHMGHKIA